MRLLLDTHVFLWTVSANRRLKPALRDYLSQADAVYVSAASIWEIAAVATLPLHHADPFDRLLLAQAFMEPLRLVTADKAPSAYGGAIEVI